MCAALDFMFSNLGKILETLQQDCGKILLTVCKQDILYNIQWPIAFSETLLCSIVEFTELLRVTACIAID